MTSIMQKAKKTKKTPTLKVQLEKGKKNTGPQKKIEEKKNRKIKKKETEEEKYQRLIVKYEKSKQYHILFEKSGRLPLLTIETLKNMRHLPWSFTIDQLCNKMYRILNSPTWNEDLYDLLGNNDSNPYRLVEIGKCCDPPLITYKKAKKIEDKFNLEISIEQKIPAMIGEVIYNNGRKSTYMKREDFYESLKTFLKDNKFSLPIVYLTEKIKETIIQIEDKKDKSILITTKRLFEIEREIQKMILILKEEQTESNFELKKKLLPKFLTKEQIQGIKTLLSNNVSLLYGAPGTGKTVTVNEVIKQIKAIEPNKRIICAAIAGTAARNMKSLEGGVKTGTWMKTIGVTNNNFYSQSEDWEIEKRVLNIQQKHEQRDMNGQEEKIYKSLLYKSGLVLILDECSMIDMFQMYKTLSKLVKYAHNSKTKVKLIMLGDKDQLPSIDMGNIFSDFLNSNKITMHKLLKIHRQDLNNEGQSYLLKQLRENEELMKEHINTLQKNKKKDLEILTWPPNKIKKENVEAKRAQDQENWKNQENQLRIVLKKKKYKNNPKKIMILTPQNGENKPYYDEKVGWWKGMDWYLGRTHCNKIAQQIFNIEGTIINPPKNYKTKEIYFKVGDRIILNDNKYDYKMEVLKGSPGKIQSIDNCEKTQDPDDVLVHILFDEHIGQFEKDESGNEHNITFSVKVRDLYVDYEMGYACSIHKSQGATYDNVVLICLPHHCMWGATSYKINGNYKPTFSKYSGKKLLYVGTSRQKEKLYVITQKKSVKLDYTWRDYSMLRLASMSRGERITGLFKDHMVEVED